MRRMLFHQQLFCFFILLPFSLLFTKGAAQSSAARVLVLTERGGLHEGFVAGSLNWLDSFARQQNLTVRVVNHPAQTDSEGLTKYRLIIQLNYPPYNWTDKSQAAFVNYMEEGKGSWIGFHHASLLGEFDGYPMWTWFSGFMGGIRFKNYIAAKATGTVHVEDRRHPVLKDLPDSFRIPNDEWYVFDKNPRPRVHVLATVDENSYRPPSGIRMGDHPVIWTNEKIKAKNVYFLMGHDAALLQTKAFTTLFANAILWALDKTDQSKP